MDSEPRRSDPECFCEERRSGYSSNVDFVRLSTRPNTLRHCPVKKIFGAEKLRMETSQELRMLSSVTINCQVTKIVMNSGSQLSEL